MKGSDVACPAHWDWDGFCGHIASEASRSGSTYWTEKLVKLASTKAPGWVPPVPDKFPPARPKDHRVRVGILSPGAYLGGAERCISDYLDHCDSERIRWDGIAILHDPTIPAIPAVLDDWREHAPVRTGERAINELARRVDVLLTWGIPSKHLEQLIPADLPVVEVSHCAFDTPHAYLLCEMERSVKVAVHRTALRGLHPRFRDSATILWNAVSDARVVPLRPRNDVRAGWGVPDGGRVVGWLARISNEKRPELFIDGIKALPKRLNYWGVMVGAGLATDRAKAYAKKIGADRVIFAGPTTDVGSTLAAFDCLVMTTKSEGLCLSIAEAWLAGVPVISTRVGVLEDEPELARILPEAPRGNQIAAAILADAEFPDRTADRVEKARQFARERLGMDRFGREWTNLLCSTAATRPKPAPVVRPALDPVIRDAVNSCEFRGPVLPISQQTCSTCQGRELSECRAGKGTTPGRVSLRDCINCQAEEIRANQPVSQAR